MFHIYASTPLRALVIGGGCLLSAACGLDASGDMPDTGPARDSGVTSPRHNDAGRSGRGGHDAGADTGHSTSDAKPGTDASDAGTIQEEAGPDAPEAATDAGSDGAMGIVDGGYDATKPPVDAGMDAGGNPCPVLTFPSGVKLQTFADAAMTASYANHLVHGQAPPACFLDVNNLIDPESANVYDLTVNVATHFQLEELVGQEVMNGYGSIVLVEPAAVAALEAFREALDTPVTVDSGFRSPAHQEDICQALCGDPLGCGTMCPNGSRHMFGDAFDLPESYDSPMSELSVCASGFKSVSLESVDGTTYLHMDQNPTATMCAGD